MTTPSIFGDRFTSTGAAHNILLPGGADYVRVVNVTQSSTTQNPGRGVIFEWFADYTPIDGALEWKKTNSTDALNLVSVTTGGFTYVDGSPLNASTFTGTAITAATPAVATATNTLSNGDRIRIWGVTGMKQVTGMVLTVSSVTSGGFTFLGLPAAGFAAAATAFTAQKILPYEQVLPEWLIITAASKDTKAVLTFSTDVSSILAIGMKYRFDVPSTYGMTQLDGLEGAITAVSGTSVPINGTPTTLSAYQVQVDIDSSGFSTFAFPASAASLSLPRFATGAPSGQKAYYDVNTQTQYGYNVNQAPFRSAFPTPYLSLAAGAQSPAGSSGDIVEWQAFRYN